MVSGTHAHGYMADATPEARSEASDAVVSERLAAWQLVAGVDAVENGVVSVTGPIKRELKLQALDILELRLRVVPDGEGLVRETRHRMVVTSLHLARAAFGIRLPGDERQRIRIKDGEHLDILIRAVRLPADPPPPPRSAIVYQRLLSWPTSPLTLAPGLAGGGAGQ